MNDRPPGPDAQLSTLLSRFPDSLALAEQCLLHLRRTFAGCNELVYDYPHSVVVAFGMSEVGQEAVVAVTILSDAVRLYLDKSLPDPKGLLEGSGGKVRSVAINAAADLEHPDIAALIEAAIERSGITFPRNGATRLVIKSKAKSKAEPKPKSKARSKPKPKPKSKPKPKKATKRKKKTRRA